MVILVFSFSCFHWLFANFRSSDFKLLQKHSLPTFFTNFCDKINESKQNTRQENESTHRNLTQHNTLIVTKQQNIYKFHGKSTIFDNDKTICKLSFILVLVERCSAFTIYHFYRKTIGKNALAFGWILPSKSSINNFPLFCYVVVENIRHDRFDTSGCYICQQCIESIGEEKNILQPCCFHCLLLVVV